MATETESGMDNRVVKDVLGRQVVQTKMRAKRPHDAPRTRMQKTILPEKCFFCPGNEHLTPPELERVEEGGKWSVRCFPNKFPAFSPDSKKAYGRHEVIVETPDHQKTLSELPEGQIFACLSLVARRMREAKKDAALKYTCVFKNEGKAAGASLEHSHTQLVGMGFVPKHVAKVGKKAAAVLALPQKQSAGVFFQNAHFASLCPKGSRFQHEIWIVPLFHASSLDLLDEAQLRSLAGALKHSLGALDALTGFGPYNMVFHSAPHGEAGFPFHLQILPRLAEWAGFEFATEVVMSSASPKESARLLRELAENRQ